ncbi:MAG TPA: undecaprenyl/decaprenyl-phosphate alpha-N-acetylglucosaminyl 1-phosphate transferase, partial [Patescibacteria group bacterium]|nr:undecaprenyl/decaprenyl-phosphate alpha-N-acetylglucosaminyl 1-phosphate transferase [Patescibacteria group bacterium]
MTPFLTFIVSAFITMLAIPVLVRLAPRLGLVDLPNARKVHTQPIPRCGGIAIAIGSAVPIFMWVEIDHFTISYLIGAAIILIFGILDDVKNINYKWKFFGQLLAIAVIILGAGSIQHLPLFDGEAVP